ncbi:GNAT family N-acetyltransferase [Antrihabitans cavernicola]|uniref:GNAT family N-acetyltransferase n=2 Tax=Antrihabitans cavernicola TaxID=2495913 RepID=A0A5A7SEN7_9NOCA|nr:GNAT family N-acetyltransferase [Spelaeibacter cavernicola]
MAWMWPDVAARRRGLPRLFAALTKYHHLAGGGAEVVTDDSGTVVGAALWDPPGGWQQSTLTDLRMFPALVRAFGRRLQVGGAIAETMKAKHPTELHWYLAMIGTDPDARGAGYGQTLMRSRLDRCDAEHSPAYLESSKAENVPYYQRFGFEVTDEIVVADGGPTVYAMWRNAR